MNQITKRYLPCAIGIALFATCFSGSVMALDANDKVQIHGYGHASYFQATGNTYDGADNNGTWGSGLLALVLTTQLDDKTTAWFQLHNTAERGRLDWAFINYRINDNWNARAGQIKLPFGLYNDIIDARFLHQSTLAPMLYQEATGILAENYRGIGVIYANDFSSGGRVEVNPYFGELIGDDANLRPMRMAGVRLIYETPIDGLRLMGSAYNSKIEDKSLSLLTHQKSTALSVDYAAGRFDVKAEYGRTSIFDVSKSTYYAQAAYDVTEKWTPFVRYDHMTNDTDQSSDVSYSQRAIVAGFSYKLNNSTKLRLEDHFNHGYGMPVASGEVAPGMGKVNWNMIGASIAFIF